MFVRNKCGASGWCPLCYEGRKGRKGSKGHVTCGGVSPGLDRRREKIMKRPAASADDGKSGRAATDQGWESRFPHLLEMLVATQYEDGSARETATLMVIAEHGRFKLGLNDRDTARSCWTSGRTVDEALEALDRSLEFGDADWRGRPSGGRGGRGK